LFNKQKFKKYWKSCRILFSILEIEILLSD
jgi:hypothetical protein